MSAILVAQTIGATFNGTNLNSNWDEVEASFNALGPSIISGLVPAAGTGLSVDVTAGTALFGGRVVKSATFTISGLADATTNHLYLKQDGTTTSNTTGIAPADSVKLGTAVTAAGAVTSVATDWASGRQLRVRAESLVPGSGAGHPRAVNLNAWHATNNEGNEVKGVLPMGSLPFTSQASGTEIRAGLISLGLFQAGGTNHLNTNGGAVTCGNLAVAGSLKGSATALTFGAVAITPPTDADVTLSSTERENLIIVVNTGAWTVGRNIIGPNNFPGVYFVRNDTAFTVTFKSAAGAGIAVPTGKRCFVYYNGSGYSQMTTMAP